jgi:hypothetical protein
LHLPAATTHTELSWHNGFLLPWPVMDNNNCFVVRDKSGQALAFLDKCAAADPPQPMTT